MRSVPASASEFEDLDLGQAFNSFKGTAGISLFENVIKKEPQNVGKYSFTYKVVTDNSDVKDLLDISGDLSLKVKAGIASVGGAAEYLSEREHEDGFTELLAVMKCFTVCEKLHDMKSKLRSDFDEFPSGNSIGTHYVSSVTYGGEMVVSVKFKNQSQLRSTTAQGGVEGQLEALVARGELKAQLDKMTRDCSAFSDIEIRYYATVQLEKSPRSIDEAVELIQKFPQMMRDVGDGWGVPLKFGLRPLETLIKIPPRLVDMRENAIDIFLARFESRFDDVRDCYKKLTRYFESVNDAAPEATELNKVIGEVLATFKNAIRKLDSARDEKQLTAANEAYEGALGGENREAKFMAEWRKFTTKLPEGRDLTVVLFGKTGNGKSATANQIIGVAEHFVESESAQSATAHCTYGRREGDRRIRVIDTPGVFDTSVMAASEGLTSNIPEALRSTTEKTFNELAKVFDMAPMGLDAILLVGRYGVKFTSEESEALQMLLKFLGEKSKEHMILVLTHGDQASRLSKKKGMSTQDLIGQWLKSLPDWVQEFVQEIKNRVVLFDNMTHDASSASKEQVSQVAGLVKVVDQITAGRGPFINDLTEASRKEMIEDAVGSGTLVKAIEQVRQEEQRLQQEMRSQGVRGARESAMYEAPEGTEEDRLSILASSLPPWYPEWLRKKLGRHLLEERAKRASNPNWISPLSDAIYASIVGLLLVRDELCVII